MSSEIQNDIQEVVKELSKLSQKFEDHLITYSAEHALLIKSLDENTKAISSIKTTVSEKMGAIAAAKYILGVGLTIAGIVAAYLGLASKQ